VTVGAEWIAFAFSEIVAEIVAMSWRAAVLIVIILAAQILVGRWLGPEWRYRLWLLVLVRLMLPTSIESRLSIFNYLRPDGLRLVWVRPVRYRWLTHRS
jgi:beta-lactamase regulating signal transducer with metallopeptidase domain